MFKGALILRVEPEEVGIDQDENEYLIESHFRLYREIDNEPHQELLVLRKEAENLILELQRLLGGSTKVRERMVVPNIEKPRKANPAVRRI
jgi:hypothetical protein